MIDMIKTFVLDNASIILPIVAGGSGAGLSLLFVVPMLSKTFDKYMLAIDQLTRFINLHSAYMKSDPVREDFNKVIGLWDDATEHTAKICGRLKLRKLQRFFTGVIREKWYR